MTCQCGTFQYYDELTSTCKAQMNYSKPCSIDLSCRVDKHLGCFAGKCQCISSYPMWSSGYDTCIVPLTYTQTCYLTSDCDTSNDLVCNNGTYNCSCPINLPTGKCDCLRTNNNEYFWNGSACSPALGYNQSCLDSSTSYMCQTLTQGTICSGSTSYYCSCPTKQYFNLIDGQCEYLLLNGDPCTQSDACNIGLGLSCQNSLCQCDSTLQFWNGSSCINYFTYNTGICTSDSECYGNLICKTASTSCLCPSTVSNGYCDCPNRTARSEYYWNGTTCVTSNSFNQSCSSASTNYMCQTLTQGTLCTGPAPFKCQCSSSQYFNLIFQTCQTLISNYSLCTQANACNSALGLSCQGSFCQCNSKIHYWNGAVCVNLLSYNSGNCASDSQCLSSLICLPSGSSSCNCPQLVPSNKCDCLPPDGDEQLFWNGTECVDAAFYNQSCSGGDYSCQTVAENTICDLTKQICTCSSSTVWNNTECVGCPSGWFYYRGSCFKGSIGKFTNIDTITPEQLLSNCFNESSARLAILQNSDATSNIFTAANGFSGETWFDFAHSTVTLSTVCASFQISGQIFKSHPCHHNHEIMCEIVL